jgi:hypothetical protein
MMNMKQRRVVIATLLVLALGSVYYGVETKTTSSTRKNRIALAEFMREHAKKLIAAAFSAI